MLALAFRFIQRTLVKRQFRRGTERIKRLLGDRHQFRIEPGSLACDLGTFGIDPVPAGRVDRIGGIFIPFQTGIDPDLLAEAVQLIRSTEGIPQHSGRFRQTPLERKECRQQVIQFCKIFFPFCGIGIKGSQIPAIFFVQFRTGFYRRFHHYLLKNFVII